MLISIDPAAVNLYTGQFRRTQRYLSGSEKALVQSILRKAQVSRLADGEQWDAIRRILHAAQERRLMDLYGKRRFALAHGNGKKRVWRNANGQGIGLMTLCIRRKRGLRAIIGGH